jgi:raffinose/stachyose/melibiose transport system substrate-binding protein
VRGRSPGIGPLTPTLSPGFAGGEGARRLAIAAISLFAALVLACGCSRKTDEEIVFWHIQTSQPTGDAVNGAVERAQATEPGIVIRASALKNDPFKQKLAQAMAAGQAPDVFHTWGGGRLASYVAGGSVADLTARVDASGLRDRLLPAALRFCTIDGKVYAIPMDVSAVVMWYNRELFRQHDIAVPKTYEEFLGACAKLNEAGIAPVALGNKDKWPGAFYFIYLATRIGGTAPFRDAASRASGGTFEHPCFIRAGQIVSDLATKHKVFNRGVNVLSADDARGLFVGGKAAMILMGTWILADIRGDDPGFLDRLDCFAFPAIPDGEGDPATVVGGINAAYAMSSRCRHPDAAFALMREMLSDATAGAWAATGRIPALRREAAEDLLGENTLRPARLLFDAPDIQLYYDQSLPPALAEAHKDTTQSLFAGTITPAEAARRMEELARKIEAEGGADRP